MSDMCQALCQARGYRVSKSWCLWEMHLMLQNEWMCSWKNCVHQQFLISLNFFHWRFNRYTGENLSKCRFCPLSLGVIQGLRISSGAGWMPHINNIYETSRVFKTSSVLSLYQFLGSTGSHTSTRQNGRKFFIPYWDMSGWSWMLPKCGPYFTANWLRIFKKWNQSSWTAQALHPRCCRSRP